MSLYNMVNGVNPAAFFVLPMLGQHPDKYPRFRDCFVSEDKQRIQVYTRVGGGNRDDYAAEIDEMRESPHYVSDSDDDFDCTFATFEFNVPPEWKADFDKVMEGKLPDVSEAYQRHVRGIFPKLREKLNELWPATSEAAPEPVAS